MRTSRTLKTVRDAVDRPCGPGRRLTFEVLAGRIGYSFVDPELLARAMAHRSWCAEHPGLISNERLEFLGDAVLGGSSPTSPSGASSTCRRAVTGVRKGVVGALAGRRRRGNFDLGSFLLLGRAAGTPPVEPREAVDPVGRAGGGVRGGVRRRRPPAAYDLIERLIEAAPRRDGRQPRSPRPQCAWLQEQVATDSVATGVRHRAEAPTARSCSSPTWWSTAP